MVVFSKKDCGGLGLSLCWQWVWCKKIQQVLGDVQESSCVDAAIDISKLAFKAAFRWWESDWENE